MATKQSKDQPAVMVPVTAKVPVNYDDELYAAGDQFEVRKSDLAQLQAVDAVEVVQPADSKQPQ